MPKRHKNILDDIRPTTIHEIINRGPSLFCSPAPMTAFEEWWVRKREKSLKGKALARAAYSAAVKELCQ
jgi:hypothetical protein